MSGYILEENTGQFTAYKDGCEIAHGTLKQILETISDEYDAEVQLLGNALVARRGKSNWIFTLQSLN